MFLRSLTIRGFKSFADKMSLEFAPGVSVIVGPNGSGKSNLVDAISWVLGEQGPRALRGGQMADVIFAGSPARAALGMAEVKLVIDNSAGLIPVPMSEIEISRTIFRSGDSEYRISGQVRRLLDVQELLSESGIGRALHTVVGQGQLEDVLSARPEDRRRYIEEAAGIAKHRRRKERAERKLASLDQDLLRLSDVLTELRRQLKPLKQQAEMASRHEELTDQADELAWRLAAARLCALVAERDRRRAGWDEGLELRRRSRARLEELDDQVSKVADERARAQWALQDAEGSLQEAQSARSRAETELRRAMERESAARSGLAAEATRALRLDSMDEEIAGLQAALREAAAELGVRERELDEAEQTFRSAELARRDVEEERRRISEEAATHRAEVQTLRHSLSSCERERARLEEGRSELRGQRAAVEGERERLGSEIERLDSTVAPLAERMAALERERHGLADGVSELEEAVRRHGARKELLAARLNDLRETPGSRFLEAHPGRAIGLLRDLVEAETGWELALAAGLGPFADAVVYEEEEAALADVAEGHGATLAVGAGGPASFVLPGERTLLSAVKADPSARGLICTVLRDVYLATDLGEAVEKRARYQKASFVTPDGVLLGPAVIRTTAESDARTREVEAELAVVDHDLAAANTTLRPKRGRLEQLAREAAERSAEIEQADAGITERAERMDRLARDLASLEKEEEVLTQRLDGLEDVADAWRASLAVAEPIRHELPMLPRAPEPPIAVRVAVETLRRDRVGLETRLERVREEQRELGAQDAVALRSALEAAESGRAAAEERLRGCEDAFDAASARRNAAAAVERLVSQAEIAANQAWREASAALERFREEYEDEDHSRGDLERRIRDAERLLGEGHQKHPAEALAALSDDDTVIALEKRAELVARRLALLGRVNLLATGELEALQERHDFLARELDDVRKARRDLLDVIQRVDGEITTIFVSAFRDVAAEYERLFKDLFPGGEGRIVLTDPAEPLTSGIEIEARPGRKRVKRISLLSGGERALAAMAFLFAIFRARPSPFYLMDEVEPALDDVNLHRFLQLLQGFAGDSQVLVVTHQKRTMEVAEMLYGVSMSKDGTSKVVCQRLDHPASGDGVPPRTAPVTVPQAEPVG